MRKWAFIVAVFGIFLLFLILIFGKKEIILGKVTDERVLSDGKTKVLGIEGYNLSLYCSSCGGVKYLGKEVAVEGYLDYYNNKAEIRVLRIEVKNS